MEERAAEVNIVDVAEPEEGAKGGLVRTVTVVGHRQFPVREDIASAYRAHLAFDADEWVDDIGPYRFDGARPERLVEDITSVWPKTIKL